MSQNTYCIIEEKLDKIFWSTSLKKHILTWHQGNLRTECNKLIACDDNVYLNLFANHEQRKLKSVVEKVYNVNTLK